MEVGWTCDSNLWSEALATVGNDVVDLRAAGEAHPRFEARILSPGERVRLAGESDPVRRRWTWWAAKEAAYKAAKKLDPATVFSPRRFEFDPDASVVRHEGRTYAAIVDETPERVHVVATFEVPLGARIVSAVEPSGGDLGDSVRALALSRLPSGLEIARAGRIPVLTRGGQAIGWDLSLSHHGGWVAFACEVGENRHGGTR